MTARELASIFAISPKTIYSYAERNMIPHFKIEASVRFRGRDVAEWLHKHASLGRARRRAYSTIESEGMGFQRTGRERERSLSN